MRAKGNGDVGVCANNLLRIFRGENPFERVKGIDPRSIDKPVEEAVAEVTEEATWCVNTYEPRAVLDGVSVEGLNAPGGEFTVTAHISEQT